MRTSGSLIAAIVLLLSCAIPVSAQTTDTQSIQSQEKAEPTRLAVLWTSGDPEVAHRVCLMYTHAARKAKWFDEVKLIVWGPSARLLSADKDVEAKVKEMQADGIEVVACVACANSYGVTPRLREMGIEVKPMGRPLTGLLKEGWKILTF